GVGLVRVVDRAADVLRQRGHVHERRARHVVDDLGVDVLRATEDREARLLLRSADFPADSQLPALTPNNSHRHRRRFLPRFPWLVLFATRCRANSATYLPPLPALPAFSRTFSPW